MRANSTVRNEWSGRADLNCRTARLRLAPSQSRFVSSATADDRLGYSVAGSSRGECRCERIQLCGMNGRDGQI